ncbi:ACP S-malonyltransferase [Bacillus atrophaeus]|uniref:ACP S-malonyltransferase n=1 Tax=Bacillus atrophaeus TaxID=1452 RepID=UPI00227E8977|nr:ACP S-malonyltransferase [Bacillus atrophaeus]MCY8932443.1 ACP S-malonyltransferase [Bacillus atrophaeus]MCY8943818.1 ACP S-malonyltransferase [Bacillus atrophaeus]MCY8947741.1 ACP S-malonyltransferase [Bacillus atrophaeus]
MGKIAFVFPGQGSQYPLMGKQQYDRHAIVRQIYEEASDLIGIDMRKLCFESSINELKQTHNAQPAIFTVSYAAFKVLTKEGLEPSFMAGHSLGEITALACSGAIEFSDAIRLVRARGEIMQQVGEKSAGGMAAIKGLSLTEIQNLCAEYSVNGNVACISNYNSNDQIVISGSQEVLAQIKEDLNNNKLVKFTKLKVSAPFHSPLMQSAVEKFTQELKKYNYHDMKYPVISDLTSQPYKNCDEITGLSQHLVNPVMWKKTVDFLNKNEVKYIIEIGPNYVLRNLVKSCMSNIKAYSYDHLEDIPKISNLIENFTGKEELQIENEQKLITIMQECIKQAIELNHKSRVRLEPYDGEANTVVTLCLASAISTPNKNFDQIVYKTGVVESYKRIRKLQALLEREKRKPNDQEITEALQLLYQIFKTKKLSYKEQEMRFKMIIEQLSKKKGYVL